MRTVRSLFLIGLLTGLFSASYATDKNAGTSGAPFLKMGAGARPTSMGSAFVGIADDVNAVYFNPAGLASLSRPELTAMHTQWVQGVNYDFGAFAYPTDSGAFALSAATLQTDDLEKRDVDESLQGTFESLDSAYALSYGRNLGATFSVGVTGRYIKQKIDTVSATAWSGDIGLLKRFASRPMTAGLAIRNVGQEIKFQDEGDPQPLTIDGGIGTSLFRQRMLVGLNALKARDNGIKFGIGSEWKGELSKDFARYALRAGYNSAGTDADSASGLTVGAGLGFGRLNLDFAWVPMGDLGNTFRYAAHMRF